MKNKNSEYLYINKDLRINKLNSCCVLQQHIVNSYVIDKDTKESSCSDKWIDIAFQRNPYLLLKKVLDMQFTTDLKMYVERIENCYSKLELFINQFKDELNETYS